MRKNKLRLEDAAIPARQGDVLLVRVDASEAHGEEVAREQGAIVLALGESSGHRHQLTAKGAKLFQRGSARFLEISARGGAMLSVTSDRGEPLSVERHLPVTVPPGVFRVTIQREYTLEHQVRRVVD